jgi:hypothetical protein
MRRGLHKCAFVAVALLLVSSCYPARPYENPLTPDQVRNLLVKEVTFVAPKSADASAAEVDLYRRFAIRSAACALGKHFNRTKGTAELTFWLRQFEVRHVDRNISVQSALSASIEGPGLKGEYKLGPRTDARRNVPNPPAPAEEGRFGAAEIVGQLLSIRGDGYPTAGRDQLTRRPTPCEASLYRDIELAQHTATPAL